jgi:glucose/arabinose dehydrogenase
MGQPGGDEINLLLPGKKSRLASRQPHRRHPQATELYRMVLKDNQVVHKETLLTGLGRIRDVEVATDGSVYLLIEHHSGGRIVKLVREK